MKAKLDKVKITVVKRNGRVYYKVKSRYVSKLETAFSIARGKHQTGYSGGDFNQTPYLQLAVFGDIS